MRKKIWTYSFVIVIWGICFLPFLLAHREIDRVSEDENRYYANFPVIRTSDSWNKRFSVEFDNWISDNARFRSLYKSFLMNMEYNLFRHLEMDGVKIARNNDIFDTTAERVDLFQGRDLFSDEQLSLFEQNLLSLQEKIESKGIAFYYLQCHDKTTMEAEYYPTGAIVYDTVHKGEQVEQYLIDQKKVHIIPIFEILKKANVERTMYYQYVDFVHWNDEGAYLGYRTIIEEMKSRFPYLQELEEKDYKIEVSNISRNYSGLKYPYQETWNRMVIKDVKSEETENAFYDSLYYKEHTHYFQNLKKDTRLLMINDSFGRMFLKNSLAESFGELLTVDLDNLQQIDWIIEQYQPDVVLLECVEFNLGNVFSMLEKIK